MNALISQILALLPVFLASPTMYAGMLVIMTSGRYARVRVFFALIGNAVTLIIVGFLLIAVGTAAAGPRQPTAVSGSIDMAIGLLLVYLGFKRLFREPKAEPQATKPAPGAAAAGPQLGKYFVFGVLLTVTNPTSLASYLTAAKLTVDAQISSVDQIIAMSLAGLCFSLPILLPLVLMVISPAASERFLQGLEALFKKYGRYIVAVILVLLGAYLAAKGWRILT